MTTRCATYIKLGDHSTICGAPTPRENCPAGFPYCTYYRRAEQMNTRERELEIDQLQRERSLLYHQMDVLQARARELTHEIEELYANGK